MRRIYHNWYSRRMKACFTLLRIIHMIYDIQDFPIQPLKDMKIHPPQKKSIIITKSGNKQVSL